MDAMLELSAQIFDALQKVTAKERNNDDDLSDTLARTLLKRGVRFRSGGGIIVGARRLRNFIKTHEALYEYMDLIEKNLDAKRIVALHTELQQLALEGRQLIVEEATKPEPEPLPVGRVQ